MMTADEQRHVNGVILHAQRIELENAALREQLVKDGYHPAVPRLTQPCPYCLPDLSASRAGDAILAAFLEILAERQKQERLREAGKFLYTCAERDFTAFTHFARATVLGEEMGEVCRAVLDVEGVAEGRGKPGAREKLRAELVQVAAVAVAYLEALG